MTPRPAPSRRKVAPRLPVALRAVLLALFALVPAGFGQALLEREVCEEMRVALGEEALRLTRLVAGQMDNTIEGVRQTPSAMAAHDALIAGRPSAACDGFLQRLVQRQECYRRANLFALDGRRPWRPGARRDHPLRRAAAARRPARRARALGRAAAHPRPA